MKKWQPSFSCHFKEKVFFTMGCSKKLYNVLGVFTVVIICDISRKVCTKLHKILLYLLCIFYTLFFYMIFYRKNVHNLYFYLYQFLIWYRSHLSVFSVYLSFSVYISVFYSYIFYFINGGFHHSSQISVHRLSIIIYAVQYLLKNFYRFCHGAIRYLRIGYNILGPCAKSIIPLTGYKFLLRIMSFIKGDISYNSIYVQQTPRQLPAW